MRINFIYRHGAVWPWSMGLGFERALKELGHEVSTFIAQKDSGYQMNQVDEMAEFIKTPCDLFIVMGGGDKYAQFNYDTKARKALQEIKVPKLAYFMEGMESRTITKIKYESTVLLWTHILTCNETDVETLKAMGCPNVAYAPGWVDTDMFYPMEIKETNDVQFIGYVHKHRKEYVDYFTEHLGMTVGFYESIPDYVRGINQTKILMGIPTVMMGFPQRVTETIACGKLLLQKRPPSSFKISQNLFEDRKHIVFFDSMEEAVELAKYYLEHEDERKKIGENARQEILEKHTILTRTREFINYATNV